MTYPSFPLLSALIVKTVGTGGSAAAADGWFMIVVMYLHDYGLGAAAKLCLHLKL